MDPVQLVHVRARIIGIQSILPNLQEELSLLLAQIQRECTHPYAIGWQETSSGLVATIGKIGCPQCGSTDIIASDDHVPEIPTIFFGKPVHWINQDVWRLLFNKSTVAERNSRLAQLCLDGPPKS